jgi:hypothetical protein
MGRKPLNARPLSQTRKEFRTVIELCPCLGTDEDILFKACLTLLISEKVNEVTTHTYPITFAPTSAFARPELYLRSLKVNIGPLEI